MTVTPKALAGFSKFLYEKDIEGKFASHKYKLEIRLPKGDEEIETFVKNIMAQHKDAGNNDFAPVKDGDKIESKSDKRLEFAAGHYLMTFKSARPPVCVDTKKQSLTGQVDGGDVVKISFNAKPYDAFGGGLALYLNAVQLIEKRGGGGVSEFDDDEEGFVETGTAKPAAEVVEAAGDGDF